MPDTVENVIRTVAERERARDLAVALEGELAALTEAVNMHRGEILSASHRWPEATGLPGPQVTSADRALWTSAGVETDAPLEDHPLERLHRRIDALTERLDVAEDLARYAAEVRRYCPSNTHVTPIEIPADTLAMLCAALDRYERIADARP